MNQLVIFDVDDTIFSIDLDVKVLDDDGIMVRKITNHELYAMSGHEVSKLNLCFKDYRCADTFYNEAKPIHKMVGIVRNSLNSRHGVVFITARTEIDNFDKYLQKFHDNGMFVRSDQIMFVGRWKADIRADTTASEDKKIVFEKIAGSQKYDHIIMYDDSERNLQAMWEVSLDYQLSVELYIVDNQGHPKPWSLGSVRRTVPDE